MENAVVAGAAVQRPVVIQTLWRTGGTYLAFMLRERNPVALFYEPLHEGYSHHTQGQWDAIVAGGGNPALKHPKKDGFHYMSDYPFMPGGGVAGHSPDFAYDRFVLDEGDDAPALREYLSGLTAHAASLGRRPLFKFCRGFLRARWLQAVLDPVTVYMARRPGGTLASYDRMGDGYHYSGYMAILHKNRDVPALAPVYAYLKWLNADFADATPEMLAGRRLADLFPADVQHDVALFFWALGLAAHAKPGVLVIEADGMGDAARRDDLAAALSRHTGLDAGFADAEPLDADQAEVIPYRRPTGFCPMTAEAVSQLAPEFDFSFVPAALRPQWEALTGTKGPLG